MLLRLLTAPIALLAGFALMAEASSAQQRGAPPSGPREAGYVVVEAAQVPVTLDLTGRAVAQNNTKVRPRVGGAITAILYQPGTYVEAGTPLFSIDPVNYQASLAAAEADLARAEADWNNATTAFERAERLRATNTSSAAAVETAETTLRKAQASLASAEAALALSQAQMEWTTLRAPISGIVDLPLVSVGDLVTANQGDALTEIVQINPIQIDLTEPYALRMGIESRAAGGEISLQEPELTVQLGGGREVTAKAKLISSGAIVSSTTGTRILRFEIDNPDGLVAPGLFIHAKLTLGNQEAVLAPQRATTRERDGSLSGWIVEDGKAVKRILSETGSYGTNWVIQKGLEPGDQLLIDGTSNLREGDQIKPIAASIDAQGVVVDTKVSN